METFPALLIACIGALVLLSPLLHRRAMADFVRSRRWRGELPWPDAAAGLGLDEVPLHSGFEVGRARGLVDGVPLELVVVPSTFGADLVYRFTAELERDPGFSARKRWRDGDDGVRSGDPTLDAAIRFGGRADHLRLACDAATRAALHETVGRGAVLANQRLSLRVNAGLYIDAGVTAAGLVASARALVRCAHVLQRSWEPRHRLLGGLDDPEWLVRLRTLRTLIGQRDPHLPEALRAAADDERPAIRLVAALEAGDDDALRRLHDGRHLVDLLQCSDPELRVAAAVAYGRVGDLTDVELLLNVARRPKSAGSPRAAIEAAVGAIRDRSPGEVGRLALEAPEAGRLSCS